MKKFFIYSCVLLFGYLINTASVFSSSAGSINASPKNPLSCLSVVDKVIKTSTSLTSSNLPVVQQLSPIFSKIPAENIKHRKVTPLLDRAASLLKNYQETSDFLPIEEELETLLQLVKPSKSDLLNAYTMIYKMLLDIPGLSSKNALKIIKFSLEISKKLEDKDKISLSSYQMIKSLYQFIRFHPDASNKNTKSLEYIDDLTSNLTNPVDIIKVEVLKNIHNKSVKEMNDSFSLPLKGMLNKMAQDKNLTESEKLEQEIAAKYILRSEALRALRSNVEGNNFEDIVPINPDELEGKYINELTESLRTLSNKLEKISKSSSYNREYMKFKGITKEAQFQISVSIFFHLKKVHESFIEWLKKSYYTIIKVPNSNLHIQGSKIKLEILRMIKKLPKEDRNQIATQKDLIQENIDFDKYKTSLMFGIENVGEVGESSIKTNWTRDEETVSNNIIKKMVDISTSLETPFSNDQLSAQVEALVNSFPYSIGLENLDDFTKSLKKEKIDDNLIHFFQKHFLYQIPDYSADHGLRMKEYILEYILGGIEGLNSLFNSEIFTISDILNLLFKTRLSLSDINNKSLTEKIKNPPPASDKLDSYTPEMRSVYLDKAVKEDRSDIVEILLKHGISEDQKGVALRAAARAGQVDIVKIFITHGISQYDKGRAVVNAARAGQVDIVKIFITHGISKDQMGWTLGAAAEAGHDKVVKLLLTYEISKYDKGLTLIAAAIAGHFDIVNMLLEHKISKEHKGKALGAAAEAGQVNILKILLKPKHGISKDDMGWALRVAAEAGQVNILKIFLKPKHGISKDDMGWALRVAAEAGQVEIVKILLTHGISKDHKGRALRAAAKAGQDEVVKLLK